jgi:hypothetical protein
MSERRDPVETRSTGVRTRTMEVVVAVVLFTLGALVIYDSVRLGARWGSDGPQAGYFPFYVGLLICLSTLGIFAQAVFSRREKHDEIFVDWQPLRQVLAVLVPAIVYVAAIQLFGLYVASAFYIAAFMIWLGRYSWLRSLLVGFFVSALAFVTFEIWFQVPLYKGAFNPLAFLGY